MSTHALTLDCEPLALRLGAQAADARGELLEIEDPSTGELLATMAVASTEDIDLVVSRAKPGAGQWRRTSPAERAELCRSIARRIRSERERLAAIDVHDGGLPVSLAQKDVEAAARYFEYYAGAAESLGGRTTSAETGALVATTLVPWGVCGVILPFNMPMQLTARDLAAALAMGNAVVLKAPEQTPFAALALTEVCAAAGAPDGLVCAAVGGGDAGSALVEHPDVAHITFTGSDTAGALVMEAAARRIIPSTIELGGKSPHIVFDDADLAAVATAVVKAAMPTAGQACSAGSRVLVTSRRHDELRDLLVERLGALRVGSAATDPDVGPVVSGRQRKRIAEAIDAAVRGGAQVAIGGSELPPNVPAGGHYVAPTLVTTTDHRSRIAQAEVFGPVLTLVPFDDEAEAIDIANSTPFGLVAGIWTMDIGRALRVAEEIDAGQVHLNGYLVGGGVGIPFGGMKRSGVGRVKGIEGALEYAQVKTLVFPEPA